MKPYQHRLCAGALVIATMTPLASSQELDRTTPPQGKPAPTVSLPAIQKTALENGLAVWLVERHELPMVALNLVIGAGGDHDPLEKSGLASITADVMDEGTASRDALQISEEFENIGASFSVGSSTDGSFATLSVLSKHLEQGLEVYADVLLHPTFPEKDFERLRQQRLAGLLQQKDQPTAIASLAFSQILYGPRHPYGNNPTGTEASLKALTRDDLKGFYQTYYRPGNATLVVVGDVTLEKLVGLLRKNLAAWQAGTVSPFTVPEPPPPPKALKVYLIDKPGAPQSEIRIGYPALARSTPEYFPVTVMNRMLGGQFTSRINLNLRERHGFTYGARSGFSFLKGKGPFTASSGVQTAKTDSSLREFLYEINLMREKGMTPEELTFVKKGLIGSFALSFETPSQVAGALQSIVLYGLPEDYFQHYLQNIDAVTLDDVARVAKATLDASRMAVVVVGDLATIKPGIEALRLGDTILCDTEGHPLK